MSTDTVVQPGPSTRDALEELRADHRRIDRVLEDCERLVGGGAEASTADRSALVARLGALLKAHLLVAHELFEPALRPGAEPAAPLPQGTADDGAPQAPGHQALLEQLAVLSAAEADTAGFERALHGLAGNWRAHVQHAEAEHLPSALQVARAQGVDLLALGAAMAQRRGEILGDQGID